MNNPGKEALRSNYRWRLAQAAEIRWWRRYLRRRDKAKYLEAKRRYWRRVLREAGHAVALYDPLFHPAPGALQRHYGFITCSEVVAAKNLTSNVFTRSITPSATKWPITKTNATSKKSKRSSNHDRRCNMAHNDDFYRVA